MHTLLNASIVTRTFFLEHDITSQSEIFEREILVNGQNAQIISAFNNFSDPEQIKFKIFDNEACRFVVLDKVISGPNYTISYSFVELNTVMIKWKPKTPREIRQATVMHSEESESVSSSANSSSTPSETQKQRSKERTIGDVIKLVKQWRDIHLNSAIKKGEEPVVRINLQKAAKMIGVSKKSLDDYYYHLRVGELNNFDFMHNLDEKIGVLRNAIKSQRGNKDKKNYSRHPKKLRIIDQFKEMDESPENQMVMEEQMEIRKAGEEIKKNQVQNQGAMDEQIRNILDEESNYGQKEILKQYEDQFFGDFQFLLDEPNDPFFNFEKCFQKKSSDLFYESGNLF